MGGKKVAVEVDVEGFQRVKGVSMVAPVNAQPVEITNTFVALDDLENTDYPDLLDEKIEKMNRED